MGPEVQNKVTDIESYLSSIDVSVTSEGTYIIVNFIILDETTLNDLEYVKNQSMVINEEQQEEDDALELYMQIQQVRLTQRSVIKF